MDILLAIKLLSQWEIRVITIDFGQPNESINRSYDVKYQYNIVIP